MENNRHPENVGDGFYVENNSCTACGAPKAEAPDLIEHSLKDTGHCFFKRQPQTEAEIEMAIEAMRVSCVDAIRYGGTDEKIIKRLYELNCEDNCDNKLKN